MKAKDSTAAPEQIVLKKDDFDRFVEVLRNPPSLSQAAKTRLRRPRVWEIV